MTEDSGARVSSYESDVPSEASQTRQRKKRKWDQPAESLILASLSATRFQPLGNIGSFGGILPGLTPVSNGLLMNPLVASCGNAPQVTQGAVMQQHTSTLASKFIQPKIQDELIAREIVINDADSAVRYKLTKRQTQEEIQKSTGAVVITRGKYRPPNVPTNGEKPLYLHISAGAHLKDTAERILAVDRAAAMVEEMLKQSLNLLPVSSIFHSDVSNEAKALTACVFLGFDVDPSLNIAARIRGPNDQYINHIINETGVVVFLRGRGSGNNESSHGEEGGQPLHLFLSSNNLKSLEDARRLAENLLDTISMEHGLSRVSSSKVYSAVPPPQQVYSAVPSHQQLLAGVQNSGSDVKAIASASLTSTVDITPIPVASLFGSAGVSTVFPQGNVSQSGGMLNGVQSLPELVGYTQPLSSSGTYYNGYGGIYPHATPLQQVALALRQSSCPVLSNVAPITSVAGMEPNSNASSSSEKRPPQKRKFQEGPIGSKSSSKFNQDSEFLNSVEPSALGVRNISNMPAPKKFAYPASNGVPPTPPRIMPPPPPKFSSLAHAASKVNGKTNILNKTKSDSVPNPLAKLMEYGDDDDDSEETSESVDNNTGAVSARKPFWAP